MSGAKSDDGATEGAPQWVVTWEDMEQAQLEIMLSAAPATAACMAGGSDAIRLRLRHPRTTP